MNQSITVEVQEGESAKRTEVGLMMLWSIVCCMRWSWEYASMSMWDGKAIRMGTYAMVKSEVPVPGCVLTGMTIEFKYRRGSWGER